jgi:hypothetical protein
MKLAMTTFGLAVFLISAPALSAQYVHGYYRSSGTYVHPILPELTRPPWCRDTAGCLRLLHQQGGRSGPKTVW